MCKVALLHQVAALADRAQREREPLLANALHLIIRCERLPELAKTRLLNWGLSMVDTIEKTAGAAAKVGAFLGCK